ncbi:colicin D domain-containing protein [Streptomyces sp. F63]|uniref:colicin D domain-containing protein n=1 Tax=Streptomyces sp. F63 TaxID=2824887 RepID=UPI0035B4D5F3
MKIRGTYRGDDVVHYYDPTKRLNVMTDRNGQFISGWKLNRKQAENVLERGSL